MIALGTRLLGAGALAVHGRATRPRPDEVMWVKIEWGERELAGLVKAAGGRWNPEKKLWELHWAKVGELGLEP